MRNQRQPSEVALAIAQARRDQGLTQTKLGERAGLSRPTVARLERGVEGLSLGNLYKVMDALGLRLVVSHSAEPRRDLP